MPGHYMFECPIMTDTKTPWLKSPEDRAHYKIVDGDIVMDCSCQFFDEGETHIDFS
jgi:hypothetical protein